MVEDGPFLDGDDKAFGNFIASGLSPFQTSAAVPFGPRDPAEDVVVVITDSTAQTSTLNLGTDYSPSTPLDYPNSGSGRPFSQPGSLVLHGGDCIAKSNSCKQRCTSGDRGVMQRLLLANYERQCSAAAAQSSAQPPSSSMQCLSMRLSMPSIAGAQMQSGMEGAEGGPHETARINSRLGSGFTVAASSFTLNTGGFLSGACGPFACTLSGGSADLLCPVGNGGGHGASGGAVTAAEPPAAGDSAYSGASGYSGYSAYSGGSLEPQVTLAVPMGLNRLPDYDCSGRTTPTLPAAPNLSGLCSRDASPSPAPPQQPRPDSFLSTTGPSPADNFLRFTDLETCWMEMRDLSFIGSGAGGHVYSGTWCGMPVAVKFMLSGDANQLQRQQREAALSRLASHPHLVQTYAVAAAQLKPSHFHHDPMMRRVSGLSHTDLLATNVAAGCTTAADLYGTTSVSPAHSVRIARQSLSTVAAGVVAAAGAAAPRPSGAAGSKHSPLPSTELDTTAAANAGAGAEGAEPEGRSAAGAIGHISPVFLPALMRPSPFRATQQHSQHLRSTSSLGGLQPAGGSTGGNDGSSKIPMAANSPRGPAGASWRGERKGKMPGSAVPDTVLATTASAISAVDMENLYELQVEGKADSFVVAASEEHCGLMMFQPADVLAHIGARPGQWLTVVIMEEMDRGSLHRAIHGGIFHPTASHLHKRHRVRAIVRTLMEVAQGMAHLHSAGLVHGDLKPANVLLKANSRDLRGFVAKVSDFGVTRAMAEGSNQATVSTSDWGTVIYTAPEVFNGKSGPASDVFSFGVLTWHLTTGQMPHEDINPFAVMLAVSRGELELEWPPSVPRPLRKLGRLCMQFDAAARPSFTEIARALLKLENKMKLCGAGSASLSGASTSAVAGCGSGSIGRAPAADVAVAAAAYARVGSSGGGDRGAAGGRAVRC